VTLSCRHDISTTCEAQSATTTSSHFWLRVRLSSSVGSAQVRIREQLHQSQGLTLPALAPAVTTVTVAALIDCQRDRIHCSLIAPVLQKQQRLEAAQAECSRSSPAGLEASTPPPRPPSSSSHLLPWASDVSADTVSRSRLSILPQSIVGPTHFSPRPIIPPSSAPPQDSLTSIPISRLHPLRRIHRPPSADVRRPYLPCQRPPVDGRL
jgi:hypothetical protein